MNTMPISNYKQVRKLRKLLLEELKAELGIQSLTVEHLELVELRIQTILSAGLDDAQVKSEENAWDKKI